MKKILTILLLFISGLAYGQQNVISFDTTSYDLSYLKTQCIELSDDVVPQNPNQNCNIDRFKTLFERNDTTWHLALYFTSGVMGDIENWDNVNEENKDRYYDYQAIVLFSQENNSKRASARFVVANDFLGPYQIKFTDFNLFNDLPLLRVYSNFGSQRASNHYYMFASGKWLEIESESWQERINNFLPEGYYHYNLMSISVFDLSASSYVFDQQWEGPGDMMYDAEKLGRIDFKLAIKDQSFVINEFYFTKESTN